MKASDVDLGVERILRDFARTTLSEFRKFDAENDRRLVEMALRCGDLERQLADERIAKERLLGECEQLREDLLRERDNASFLMTGTEGTA